MGWISGTGRGSPRTAFTSSFTAFSLSSLEDMVTKPNPRLRPVSRSVITWAGQG